MEILERIQSRKDVKAISVRLLGDYKSVNYVMCKKLVASVDRFDKVVPLTEFLGEDNLSGKPLLVRFVNRSLDVISF